MTKIDKTGDALLHKAAKRILEWSDASGMQVLPADLEISLRYALSSTAQQGWQPIETHPRDKAEGRKSFLGGADGWVGEVYWNGDAQRYYLEGAHPSDTVDGSVDFLTHWQHLPPAPRVPDAEGGA